MSPKSKTQSKEAYLVAIVSTLVESTTAATSLVKVALVATKVSPTTTAEVTVIAAIAVSSATATTHTIIAWRNTSMNTPLYNTIVTTGHSILSLHKTRIDHQNVQIQK